MDPQASTMFHHGVHLVDHWTIFDPYPCGCSFLGHPNHPTAAAGFLAMVFGFTAGLAARPGCFWGDLWMFFRRSEGSYE